MIERLRPILARLAKHPAPITPETRLHEDLGIDSLAMIDLAVAIEDTFHIRVPDETAERFRTVADLTLFLDRTRPETPTPPRQAGNA